MLTMIDLGAEDVSESEDGIEVYTAPGSLGEVRKKFQEAGFEVKETELIMKPKNMQTLSDAGVAAKALTFLDSVEELEDVASVFSNLDIPDETMQKISAGI
jgi:transcriptional/translational regulatory protein YebC/TACO1